MDEADWEFLRKPKKPVAPVEPVKSTVEEEPPKPKGRKVLVFASFAGKQRDFLMDDNSTLEEVFEFYKEKTGLPCIIEHGEQVISKYTKVKSVVEWEENNNTASKAFPDRIPRVSLRIVQKKREPESQATYKIRYNKYTVMEVPQTREKTVKDLIQTAKMLIEQKEGKNSMRKANTLHFNGVDLHGAWRIDNVLLDGDLIDLV